MLHKYCLKTEKIVCNTNIEHGLELLVNFSCVIWVHMVFLLFIVYIKVLWSSDIVFAFVRGYKILEQTTSESFLTFGL